MAQVGISSRNCFFCLTMKLLNCFYADKHILSIARKPERAMLKVYPFANMLEK